MAIIRKTPYDTIALFVVFAVVLAALPQVLSSFYVILLTRALLLGLFALSFNLLLGYTGLLSFGHAAYFATGGYVCAYLLTRERTSFAVAIAGGMAASTAVAFVLGYLSVRRDEIYFAMLTLAFGMMVYTLVFQWREVTGGSDGLTGVILRPVEIGDTRINLGRYQNYYRLSAGIVLVSGWLLWRVTRSSFGETLTAIRENQERASFSGVNVRSHQWLAFIVAGFFAGIAGIFWVPATYVAGPEMAHWTTSAEPVLMTVLGGGTVFLGPMAGAIMFVFLENYVSGETTYWFLMLGLILLPLILFFRGGLLGYAVELAGRRLSNGDRQSPAPTSADPEVESAATPDTPAATAAPEPSRVVLEVSGVSKSFGSVRAVNDVTFNVNTQTITAIIGPNGAGKTTLYNVLTGRYPADSGGVSLDGEDITGLKPFVIARAGLVRSFQITSVYSNLSVRQNIRIAVLSREKETFQLWRPVRQRSDLNAEVERILKIIGMLHRIDTICAQLSHGERALIEIGMVLALDPKVILLDEPTAGMSIAETHRIVNMIGELREKLNKTILITEHDMEVVFSVAQRIIVMHQGRVLADGTPDEIRDDPAVREAYLGARGEAEVTT